MDGKCSIGFLRKFGLKSYWITIKQSTPILLLRSSYYTILYTVCVAYSLHESIIYLYLEKSSCYMID